MTNYCTYEDVMARLQASSSDTSEVLRSQIALLGTWTELREASLEWALAHLAEYQGWLQMWGFPVKLAAATVEQLRAHAVSLGLVEAADA